MNRVIIDKKEKLEIKSSEDNKIILKTFLNLYP